MPTDIPSVSRFSHLGDRPQYNARKMPTLAARYWLGRDIVRGVFKPGERLKVEQLVKFYNIGHSPVREAILMHVTAGLVSHEHNKGHRVAAVSLGDYDDVLEIYQRIYKLALGMALERDDERWEESIIIQLHRSQKVSKVLPDGDPEEREYWQRAYAKFHYKLLEGCGSPVLLKFYSELEARLERYVNLFADLESDRDRDNHLEHREIVDTLVARESNKAFALIEKYFAAAGPIRESIKSALSV